STHQPSNFATIPQRPSVDTASLAAASTIPGTATNDGKPAEPVVAAASTPWPPEDEPGYHHNPWQRGGGPPPPHSSYWDWGPKHPHQARRHGPPDWGVDEYDGATAPVRGMQRSGGGYYGPARYGWGGEEWRGGVHPKLPVRRRVDGDGDEAWE